MGTEIVALELVPHLFSYLFVEELRKLSELRPRKAALLLLHNL